MSSTTPRGRSSSHRRTRCKCAGGDGRGGRDKSYCFNPLRSLFRCPGRGRNRTPSRVRDASVDVATERQSQEASFFVYAMPSQARAADHQKKKHKKAPRLPSIRSCFRTKKKERKAKARRQSLTPAPSMVTHPPRSPPPENAQPAVPAMTQPPSPAVTENGSIYWPAPPDRNPATPRLGKQSTDTASAASPFPPQRQQPKQVGGLQIVEVTTADDRLSLHEIGLIEMVGSSTDGSTESSMKSSLEYLNEPPAPAPAKRAVADREATAVKAREPPRVWLNGNAGAKAGTGARFTETLVASEADELWAHDIACSRAHAAMLAETVSFACRQEAPECIAKVIKNRRLV